MSEIVGEDVDVLAVGEVVVDGVDDEHAVVGRAGLDLAQRYRDGHRLRLGEQRAATGSAYRSRRVACPARRT